MAKSKSSKEVTKDNVDVEENKPEKGESGDEALLRVAKERYERGLNAQKDNRQRFIDDLKFYYGEGHWDAEVEKMRISEQRPCLKVNRIPTFVRQVTNDQRQSRPSVKVSPVDSQADIDTAEVLQGLIRHIEYDSNADVAYDAAFFNAVCGNVGYIRVLSEYDDEKSFNQSLKIRGVANPLCVVPDDESTAADGSDWNWCFITDFIRKDAFKLMYPDAEVGEWSESDDDNIGDYAWETRDGVRIAEYYYFDEGEETTIYMLDDGAVVEEVPEDAEVIDSKVVTPRVLKWAKITSREVLDCRELKGKYIPVIPVYGDIVESEGERKLFSLFHFAKDAQRMFNYARSNIAEMLALQPKAPWIMAEGQDEGYEEMWDNANKVSFSALRYKPTDINGTPLPPPQRQAPPTISPGLQQLAIDAEKDLMATTGLHESSLGQRSNESSGKAILARQQEGDTATFHFADNLRRAVRHVGRVIVDLIPYYYSERRTVRVLGEDGSERMEPINQEFETKDDYGNPKIKKHDLKTGKYDVVISQGASYNTKRQEQQEFLGQVLQGNPQMMNIAGDLLFKAMDMPASEEIAARMEKLLPPQLQAPKDGEPPQIPPMVVEQMQQLQMMNEQLTRAVEGMSVELEDKQLEKAIKERELAIKEYEAETKRIAATGGDGAPAEASGLSEEERVQHETDKEILLKEMELDHKEEMRLLDARIEMLRANKDPAIADFDDDLNPVKSELAQGMEQLGQIAVNTAQAVQQLSQDINAPKSIERDEDGNITGVNGRRVIRDEDGNIVGTE